MDLVVDAEHLGTPEGAWTSCARMAGLAPLRPMHPRRVVVVAPHPDDEILGAGGLLQTLIHRRIPVEIIAVTDGEASHPEASVAVDLDLRSVRAHESKEALKRIGCPDPVIRRVALPDGRVNAHLDQLCEVLDEMLFPDDLCLAPWQHDGHPDHDACGQAAARVAHTRGADLVSYLVWAWHWADPARDNGLPWDNCRRVDLTRRVAARKRWSTGAFTSQTRPLGPHPCGEPVLPPEILRRFWRSFEVFIDGESAR